MTSRRRRHRAGEDVADAVTTQAQALVLLWDRAEDWADPRVPPSQLRVLTVLSRHSTMNLTELSRELGAIPSSASRLCDRLEAAGLLERRINVGNRREVILRLSSGGRRRLEAFAATRRADFAAVLRLMTPDAQASLVTGLQHFSEAAAQEMGGSTREA
ncbi:MAG: MarR family transcriptional regulator [Mycobacteriales bacterium]